MKLKNNLSMVVFVLLYIFTLFNVVDNATYAVVNNLILLSDDNVLKYIAIGLVVVIYLLLLLNSKISKEVKFGVLIVYIISMIIVTLISSLVPLFILLPLSLSMILVNFVIYDRVSEFEFNVLYYTSISIMLFIIFIGLFDFVAFVIYMLVVIQLILQDKISKKKQLIIYMIGLNIMFIVGQYI